MSGGAETVPSWVEWGPEQGWNAFTAHAALSEALWADLSGGGGWHYLNPTSDLSVWECQADGSAVLIAYRGLHIVDLQASGGQAALHLARVATSFGIGPLDEAG